MDSTIYYKLTVKSEASNLDSVSAIVSMITPEILVEDFRDAESLAGIYGSVIDESLIHADKEHITVSIFFDNHEEMLSSIDFLKYRFAEEKIEVSYSTSTTCQEDWIDNWKKFYHPMHFGKITIVPAWEEYQKKPNEEIVLMDPGMAFGTGTHETTRLSLFHLEQILHPGDDVLDIGTGSGILSIAASKLGARGILATDLDPDAVKNAKENIEKNHVTNVECIESNLLCAVPEGRKFDIILANIVADILLLLIPDAKNYMREASYFALSGIINDRVDDVKNALISHGYTILEQKNENDWNAILCTYRKKG